MCFLSLLLFTCINSNRAGPPNRGNNSSYLYKNLSTASSYFSQDLRLLCLLIHRIIHGPWISVTFCSLPECSVVFRIILRSSILTNHFPSRTRLIRRLLLRSFRIRLKRGRPCPNPKLSSMFRSCDFAAHHLTLLRSAAGRLRDNSYPSTRSNFTP